MKCILCNSETTGSVGAAGIRWANICQKCKNEEDALLESKLQSIARVMDLLEGAEDDRSA